MICKHCLKPIPWAERHATKLVTVEGIGTFHAECISPEEERRLEERIDDVKRWAIEVGIIQVSANHDPEHADAKNA